MDGRKVVKFGDPAGTPLTFVLSQGSEFTVRGVSTVSRAGARPYYDGAVHAPNKDRHKRSKLVGKKKDPASCICRHFVVFQFL